MSDDSAEIIFVQLKKAEFMRSTFKVLFYLKRTKNTPRAVYPIMGRITVNGTISQFSAKINVPEQLWEVKGGRAAYSGGYPFSISGDIRSVPS